MPQKYAADTTVSVERSEAEVRSTLSRYGCYDIVSGTFQGQHFIVAHYKERRMKITVKLPEYKTENAAGVSLGEKRAKLAWQKECRRQWRVLVLLLKAKFEAVMATPEIFEYEFLAYIVDPATGQTIGEAIVPQIADRYDGGKGHTPLLLGPAGGGNWRGEDKKRQ